MNNPLTTGTFLKNGYNRYFRIDSTDAQTTTLSEYNGHGPTGKSSVMGTAMFNKLYAHKNWITCIYRFSLTENRWCEKRLVAEGIQSIGGTRFLIKPAKFQF